MEGDPRRLLLGKLSSVLAKLGWMCQWDIRGHLGICGRGLEKSRLGIEI